MLGSGNPVLNENTWDSYQTGGAGLSRTAERARVMTLSGVITATSILLAICVATGVVTYGFVAKNTGLVWPIFGVSMVGALVLSLVLAFKPMKAPWLAPIVAVFEGGFVGVASVIYPLAFAGAAATTGTMMVAQAAMLTVGIFAVMLIAYGTRLVRPSRSFLNGIMFATMGVVVAMMGAWIVSFFVPGFFGNMWSGPLGLAIAGVIVVLATLNLLVDFDYAERGIRAGAPKQLEWFAGFGLLVTIVWLYISLLRLLSLLNRE